MKKFLKKNIIVVLFLIIPFFKPIGLSYLGFIDYGFKVWKLISMIIIMFILIKEIHKEKKINADRNFIGLVAFWMIYLTNCLINRTISITVLSNIISIFLIFEIINYECKKNNGNELLDALEILFTIYLILQFVSVLYISIMNKPVFYPINNDYIYFLGTDNYSAFQIIPMLTIIIYNNTLKRNSLCVKNILLTLIVVMCNIITKSYTAMLATIVLLIFLIFNSKIKNITKFLSIKKVIVAYIILMVLILGFNIQNIFTNVLENQMKKGITLNSRTIIWTDALELIKEKPLFGYGILRNEMVKSYSLYGVEHAHNMLLDLLLKTGVLGTIAYIVFLIKTISNDLFNSKSNILYLGLLAFFILSFMDFYPEILTLYLLIGIIYHSKSFETKEKQSMKLGVVVLNYNNYEETEKCVNSILKQKMVKMEIVIVDNGSINQSYNKLFDLFDKYSNIHLIKSKINLGYAKGNNLGIEYLKNIGINCIFVANSDLYFASENTMKQILDSYESGVGVITPLIQNLDGKIDQRVAYKRRFLYLRIIKKILEINFGVLSPNNKHKKNDRANIIIENNKKLIGIQRNCYVIAGSGFLLTPDFFANYSKLFSETFLYFEEYAIIIMLYKAKLLTKIANNDKIIHRGAASSYNGENADIVKLNYMKESSKKICKLIFTIKKHIN